MFEEIVEEIKKIIPDAKEFTNEYGRFIKFTSKGRDKFTKKCVALYDNNGIKTIVKQIDYWKGMTVLTNGQPNKNCKTIYHV